MRIRRDCIHQEAVEQIRCHNAFADNAAPDGGINQHLQQFREFRPQGFVFPGRRIQLQDLHEPVFTVSPVTGLDQALFFCIVQQTQQGGSDGIFKSIGFQSVSHV